LPNIKITLHLNTLGDRATLKKYKEKLCQFFEKNMNSLSKDSKLKIKSNPLRILDSKDAEDKKLISEAPKLNEFINGYAHEHFESVKKYLDKLKIDYFEDKSLVRGLDYYCHTVFEFKTDSLGSQDTLIGGGRYDGLIETLGGKNIPGIGWAGGVERIILLMDDIEINSNVIHFSILDKKYKEHALIAYNFLIKNNFSVYWNYKYNLKKSLSNANELKAKYVIIIGEDEFNESKFTLKNLQSGKQTFEDLDSIINILK